jgi:1,4-dihydroxy-2-naphthoate octaprenyltransferase
MRAWWLAIRPRTLVASLAPVAVGAALAAHDQAFRWAPALAALAGALLIQIGTNLTNDVLDYRRGADNAARLGPTRVVQAGLLSAREVAIGAAGAFGGAVLVGTYLVRVGGLPILVLGLAAIASGILYTAGPWPLAYLGLGDLFVLAFFGIAAVAGTYYVQALALSGSAVALGVAVGALAVAILAVNNLRDLDTDRAAGKRTLAVRFGDAAMRRYYALLVALAFAIPVALLVLGRLPATVLLVLLGMPLAVVPLRRVWSGAVGSALNPVLGRTARLQLAYAALLCAALLL